MALVSVIVPVYNLEEEISKCIFSILLQKFTDYEIIAIDDGSTDNSLSLLKGISKKYPELRVFHTENNGLSAARNLGIKKARGKYLAFVDGDDYLDPKYLSKLFSAISGADISVCGYTEFFNGKPYVFSPRKEVLSGAEATKRLLRKQHNVDIISWNKLYKKSLFCAVNFPNGKNHEDNFTTYKLYSSAEKVSVISEPLYSYVRRDDSITKREQPITRLNAKLFAAKEAIKYFKNTEFYSDAEFSEILAFYQFVDFAISKKIPKENFKKYREKILESKVSLDRKRKIYRILLIPFSGFFYKVFRKIKHE